MCIYVIRHLNDVFTLDLSKESSVQWEYADIKGPVPSPRESHTSVTIGNNLLVYGGMGDKRHGDVWILNVGKEYIQSSNKRVFHQPTLKVLFKPVCHVIHIYTAVHE